MRRVLIGFVLALLFAACGGGLLDHNGRAANGGGTQSGGDGGEDAGAEDGGADAGCDRHGDRDAGPDAGCDGGES